MVHWSDRFDLTCDWIDRQMVVLITWQMAIRLARWFCVTNHLVCHVSFFIFSVLFPVLFWCLTLLSCQIPLPALCFRTLWLAAPPWCVSPASSYPYLPFCARSVCSHLSLCQLILALHGRPCSILPSAFVSLWFWPCFLDLTVPLLSPLCFVCHADWFPVYRTSPQ